MPTPREIRARFEHRLSRRRALGTAGGAIVAVSLAGRPTRVLGQETPGATPLATPGLGADPFTLGVASGDPHPDSVVLWTRLAPDPGAADGLGGMPGFPVEVRWELASDDGFTRVIQSGSAVASPVLAHSVHVDVTGLAAGTEYFYRFMADGQVSEVGRTRTAPAVGARVDRLRFALASCQRYDEGYFTSYPHIIADDPDLVIFLGDYIYEYGEDEAPDDAVRLMSGPRLATLAQFRNRHAQYRTDRDLRAAHAAAPWVVTWDDHEVANDYEGDQVWVDEAAVSVLDLRAASYQAFYEHLPLRPSSMPAGPDMQLYRSVTWGDLASFQVLDTRQYRTPYPSGPGEQVRADAAFDAATTMTGPDQERWLLANLDASQARWNVIAQQVMMGELLHSREPEVYWTDAWDGYPAARTRILGHLAEAGTRNPVVITGDWHSTFVNDLRADFEDDASPVVAPEFVVTSISSNGDGGGYGDYYGPMVPLNPHIRFFDGDRRGYQLVDVTPERWEVDVRMVDTVLSESAGVSSFARFTVEDGQHRAEPS